MAAEQIVTNIVATADFSSLLTNVNRVTASLSELQQKLAATNKALANQVKAINTSFAETLRSTNQYSTHFVSLTSDVEKFGKQLDTGRLKLRDYFRVYQDHHKTAGGLIRDLAKQQVQLQNAIVQPLGRNAEGLMQYNVHIPRGLDLTKNKTSLLKQELMIMNKVIQDGGIQLINWGKNTQWAGRQLTVGLTLPLVAFGKAAADAFRAADQELTRLAKVYGDIGGATSKELTKIRADVSATAKELSSAMGVNFKETIALAADIAATGKQGNELLSSVSETTRLAVLGEVDRQDAMKATLAIQTAFKSNTEELADSINFLNAVENQTSTTLNDLVEAIPKAGPIIKGLGGDVQDLALYLTAMREGGINASEGANALKSALASLINPTDVAVDKFRSFGIDLLGIVKNNAGNVTETLFALQAALDRLDPLQKQQAIEQLFGKFQFSRLNALFENLGRQGSQTLQVLDLMKASAGELESIAARELTAVTESAAGRYRRAVEGLKADLAGVGEQFLNIGTKIVNIIDKIIEFGGKLPGPVKQLLAIAGGFTAIAGPVIMLTGVLANFFGYIIKGLGYFKALFKGGQGWKLLTPEIIAANKAGELAAQTFYSDAKAASILNTALTNLINSYNVLEQKAKSGAFSIGPAISTLSQGVVVPGGGRRLVNVNSPYLGSIGTRDSTHMNPADPNNPATMFGLVPGTHPVNLRVGRNPQIYSHGELPNIPGFTRISGVSTGVVATEAARWHTMTATLGMQSMQEIEQLKSIIASGGTISSELMATYDDLFPLIRNITDGAATQSAAIVSELRAGIITVESARAKIMSLNAQIESEIAATATAFATSRGRYLDVTRVPLIDQPAVDPVTGKSNFKELFKKERTAAVVEEMARRTGTRTYGAPYNIETTVPYKPGALSRPLDLPMPFGRRRFNDGGKVVYMTNGETVPGPNINADVVPAMLTPGEFVLTRGTVAREGSDAVEALHRGEATIVPFNANRGGQVPGYNIGSFVKLLRNLSSRKAQKLLPGFRGSQKYYQAKGTAGVYIGDITDPKILSKYPEFVKNGKISRQSINSLVNNGRVPGDLFAAAIKASGAKMLGSADNFLIGLLNNGIITKSQFNKISKQIEKDYFSYLSKASGVGDSNNKYWSIANKVITKELGGRSSNAGHLWHGYSSSVGQFTGSNTLKSGTSGPSTTPRLIKVSDKKGNIINFGKLEGEENYLFAHTKTPDPLIQRAKTLNAGGMVHGYNRGGMVGGYSRGGRIPGVQNKRFGGFVASSLLSMLGYGLGSSAGQNVGGQTGSMIGGTIGSILPFMLMGSNITGRGASDISSRYDKSIFQGKQFGQVLAGQAMQGGKVVSTLSKLALGLTRTNLITGALVVGGGILLKVFKDHAEAQARLADSYGLTADRAKTLGVNYTDYVKVLKSSLDTMQLARDNNRALYESIASSKTPLNLTIEKYKELRKEVKKTMTRELEIVNESNAKDLSDLLVRLKVQLMATGMSAKEATQKLYTLVSLSNFKSMRSQATLLNKEFTNIKTATDAATKAMKLYQSTVREGLGSKVQFNALSTALNAIGNALDVPEDKNKTYFENQKERYNQESKFIDELKQKGLGKAEVDKNVIDLFIAQDAALAGILGRSETVLSIWQKIQIVAKGFTGDLVRLNAEQVSALYDLVNSIYNETVENQGFGTLKDEYEELNRLTRQRESLLDATERQSAADQISSRKRIEFLQEEINKIKEAGEERKKSLQDEQDAEDYLLQIQREQLKYQQAIAAGNLTDAAEAQISIRELSGKRQTKLALDAIDADIAAKIKPYEEEIKSINKANQDLADKVAIAADSVGKLDEKITKLESTVESVTKAITDYRVAVETGQTGDERRDAAIEFLETMGIKVPKPGTAGTTGKDIVDLADQVLKKYLENQEVNTAIIKAGKVYLDTKAAGAGTSSEDPRKYTDKKITDALLKLGIQDKKITQFKEGRTLDAVTGAALIKELGIKPGEYFQAYGGVYRHDYSGGITKVRDAKSSERKTFFEGGPISGPGTSTSDSIPILASNGEYMWSARAVQNAGGPNAVDAMHNYFKNSKRMATGGYIPGLKDGGMPDMLSGINKNNLNLSNKNNDNSDSWADKSILSAISLAAISGGAATLFKSIKKTGFYTHNAGPDVKYFSYLEKGNPKAILRAQFDGEKWIANMFAKDPNAKIPSGVTSEIANRAGKLKNIVWDTNSQSPSLRKFIQKNPNTGIRQAGSTHNYEQPDLWDGLRKEYRNTRGIRSFGFGGGGGGGIGLFNNLNMANGGYISARMAMGGPIKKKSTPVMSSAKTGPAALADRIATEKWYKENGYFKDSDGVWRKNPPSFLEKYTTKQNWKDLFGGMSGNPHGLIYDDIGSKLLTFAFGPGASDRYFGGENFATGEWLTALSNVALVGRLGNIAARGFIEQAGIMQGIPNLGKLLPQGSIPYLTGATSQSIKGASNLAMVQAVHSLIANKFSSTIGKDSPLGFVKGRRAETAARRAAIAAEAEASAARKAAGLKDPWDDIPPPPPGSKPFSPVPSAPTTKSLSQKIVDSIPGFSAAKFIFGQGLFDSARRGVRFGSEAYTPRWSGDFNTFGMMELLQEIVTPIAGKIGEKLPGGIVRRKFKTKDYSDLSIFDKYLLGESSVSIGLKNIPKNIKKQFIKEMTKIQNSVRNIGGNAANKLQSSLYSINSDTRKSLLLSQLMSKLPRGARSILETSSVIHRSPDPILNLLKTSDVSVRHGRRFGPGMYFAQNKNASDRLFKTFGNYAYRVSTSPLEKIRMLFSKGYLTEEELIAMTSNLQNAGIKSTRLNPSVESTKDPLVQYLIKKGYIGYKNEDILTNWLIGDKPGVGLKLIESPSLVEKGLANLAPKILNFGDTFRKPLPIVPKMMMGGYINPSTIKINSIPKFDGGINVVPADMLAMIHKNEAVIPAQMNPFNPNNNGTIGTTIKIDSLTMQFPETPENGKQMFAEFKEAMHLDNLKKGGTITI